MSPYGRVPPSQLRVSDAERHQVAEALSRNFADGRLDETELDERTSRAMAAKTRADLAGLLADLPATGPAPAPRAARGPACVRHPLALAAGYLLLFMMAVSFVRRSLAWHALGPAPHGLALLMLMAAFLLLVQRGRRRRHGGLGNDSP